MEQIILLYSHAALFVYPSVYEPFGIINLEAMACGTPVVAAAAGGIPEVAVHGQTGILVPFEPASSAEAEPLRPEHYAQDLAAAINELLRAPERRQIMEPNPVGGLKRTSTGKQLPGRLWNTMRKCVSRDTAVNFHDHGLARPVNANDSLPSFRA